MIRDFNCNSKVTGCNNDTELSIDWKITIYKKTLLYAPLSENVNITLSLYEGYFNEAKKK